MLLEGCLCLAMPRRAHWESLSGRPAAGILATRGADVGLLIAEALAHLRLPASIAPGVAALAMQDVLDATIPAYFDDWSQFGRAATTIPAHRIVDYVAALTAGGSFLPVDGERKVPDEPGRFAHLGHAPSPPGARRRAAVLTAQQPGTTVKIVAPTEETYRAASSGPGGAFDPQRPPPGRAGRNLPSPTASRCRWRARA